ncbi:MAG: hypothetical protein AAGL18_05425 [Pseudomonadota bacterium]
MVNAAKPQMPIPLDQGLALRLKVVGHDQNTKFVRKPLNWRADPLARRAMAHTMIPGISGFALALCHGPKGIIHQPAGDHCEPRKSKDENKTKIAFNGPEDAQAIAQHKAERQADIGQM